MKKIFLLIATPLLSMSLFAQTGHIMQGIGARNMSMGGAATGKPIDISGALQWNPAAISVFKANEFSVNAGAFFSSPQLSSTAPTSEGPMSGVTEDDRGTSIMPALAMVWGKKDSKHHFGVSAFGISGFGVTFPESMTNPINMPQSMHGFGKVESNYQLMQVGLTYAYELSEKFSVGIAPTFNYAMLELEPNPLANPSQTLGYPVSDKASATGFGAQIGLFFNSGKGFTAGASYKSKQSFSEFEFNNKYLDGSTAPGNSFKMNYPAIYSIGAGYSKSKFDFALDYRMVDYKNTEGFAEKGWTNTGSVKGFGWENISIVSAGVQYKGIEKFPLRVGYTYSSNPINSELAFFSVPATAVIANAFQLGFGYIINEKITLDAVYHHGASNGSTSGPLLNPMMASPSNPYGAVPSSEVSYKMTTDMVMIGLSFKL